MLNSGDIKFDFEILNIIYDKDIDSKIIHCRHKSGLELLHIFNKDVENFFSYNFFTPPCDNYGLPHIIEHTLFCGSEKFQNKDNFFALENRSVQTFMNAMTGSDITYYLAASCLEKDYFNLLEVYGDAVFYPLLRKKSFETEAVHLDLDEKERPIFSGIVYNEMKGFYSNPHNVILQNILSGLFPDTHYKYEAGGDPNFIPLLKYDDFLKFHKKNFGFNNCKILLYGNIDTLTQLEFISKKIIKNFEAKSNSNNIFLQKSFSAPIIKKIEIPKVDNDKNCSIFFNWAWSCKNRIDALELELLSNILVSNLGSPLAEKLLEFDFVEDIHSVTGFYPEFLQPIFVCGLKLSKKVDIKYVEDKFLNLLKEFYTSGLPKQHIEAAVVNFEFQKREIKSSYPLGFRYLEYIVPSWIYYNSPFEFLDIFKMLDTIKENVKSDDKYFEKLIHKFFLSNTHKLSLIASPSKNYEKQLKKIEKKNIELVFKEQFSKNKILLKENIKEFREYVKTDLSEFEIPKIEKDDIKNTFLKNDILSYTLNDMQFYYQPNFTNNITYLNLYFDITDFDNENLTELSVLSKLIFSLPHIDKDFNQVSSEAMLWTGGTYSYIVADTNFKLKQEVAFFVINAKFLDVNCFNALNFIYECLTKIDFNFKKVKDTLLNFKNNFISTIVDNGTYYAGITAKENISSLNKFFQNIEGIEFYKKICGYLKNEDSLNELISKLKKLYSVLFAKNRLIINFSCDNKFEKKFLDLSRTIFSKLNIGKIDKTNIFNFILSPKKEKGIILPTLTSFNAVCISGPEYGSENFYKMNIVSKILKNYIIDDVRLKFGAYGANISVGDKYILLTSYRDAKVKETLKYLTNAIFLLKNKIDDDNFSKAVIKILSSNLVSLKPEEKNNRNFFRKIFGIDDSMILKGIKFYESCRLKDITDIFSVNLSDSYSVSFSSEKKLLSEKFDVIERFL